MNDTNEIVSILGITLLAYIIEYFKYQLDLSILNIFLLINLIGLYYIFNKLKITIKIEYNN